jgi:2-polyprenyl-3-methyl-5-hydroxy-6-metoxy-1,4-benzoquinol methylase
MGTYTLECNVVMSDSTAQPEHEPTANDSAAADSAAKYDAAYRDQQDFITQPNRFLVECIARIAGAGAAGIAHTNAEAVKLRAMEIGIGQGRNSILLAQHGFETFGIDRSDVGVRAARQRAAELGLAITAVIADATSYDFGLGAWDVIVMLYYPAPMLVMEPLKAAVKPGGHIIVERFSQPKLAQGADLTESKRSNPMLQSFADWHVLHYEHDVFNSDWHWRGESPRGPIVRVLARKP